MSKQLEYQSNLLDNNQIESKLSEEKGIGDTNEGNDREMRNEEPNQSEDQSQQSMDDMSVKVTVEAFKCSVDGCNEVVLSRDQLSDHWKTDHMQQKSALSGQCDDNQVHTDNLANNSVKAVEQTPQTPQTQDINTVNIANEPLLQPMVSPETVASNEPNILTVIQCPAKSCSKVFLNKDILDKHWHMEHKNIDQTPGQTILMMAHPPNGNSDQVGAIFAALPSMPALPSKLTSSKPKKFRKSKTDPIVEPKFEPIQIKEPEEKRKLLYLGKGKGLDKQSMEIVLNLYDYFKTRVDPSKVMQEVAEASRVGYFTVRKVLNEFKTTGTFTEAKKTRNRELKFKYIPADRDVLSRCVYKLKEENRLRGPNSVYNEIKTSNEYNPTFKKCSHQTFIRIFKSYGFRISETKIIDHKPEDAQSERQACSHKDPTGEYYLCNWPGCDKRISAGSNSKGRSNHMADHLRTHTGVKPYVCRFPKCQYRCAVAINFTKHLKIHHKSVFEADDDQLV